MRGNLVRKGNIFLLCTASASCDWRADDIAKVWVVVSYFLITIRCGRYMFITQVIQKSSVTQTTALDLKEQGANQVHLFF
jgi:uncharacterized membrane protein YkvI